MLLINVKQDQHIDILRPDGERYVLTIKNIRTKDCSFILTNAIGHLLSSGTIRLGDHTQLLNDVVGYGKRIVAGDDAVVTIGFDAPRAIRIQGRWNRVRTQLSSLSDKELVTHTYQIGTTKLEHELAKRLESRR